MKTKATKFLEGVISEVNNVRNFWAEANVDGGKKWASGPKSKNGDMDLVVYVRENGESVKAIVVDCIPQTNGDNLIRVVAGNKTVFEKTYKR